MTKRSPAMICILIACFVWGIPSVAQDSKKLPDAPAAKTQTSPSNGPFKDLREKASYAIGMNLANSFKRQSVDIDPDLLAQGLKDAAKGKTLITDDEARDALTQFQTELRAKAEAKRAEEADANKKEGEAFLAANKSKQGIVTTASGLQYKVLTPGTGPKPASSDKVTCNYKGTFINGTEFDSSYKRGEPTSFEVGHVIKGWTEALQLMPVGSKWQLFVPSELAYGEQGTRDGTIGPNATLVFEVELLSIQPKNNPAKDTPPAK